MALTDTLIRELKPTSKLQKLIDGNGLCLLIGPTGKKVWRLGYRHEGQRKTWTIGPYPEISLATARAKAAQARRSRNRQRSSNR